MPHAAPLPSLVVIDGFSPAALQQLASLGGGSSVTVVVDLSEVERALAMIAARLADITDLLRNPDATAADEKCRKGALALSRGWYADAVPELQAAIAAYRFRALPHLLLGWSRLGLGDSVTAVEDLQAAIRYASADEDSGQRSVGVTAALLAAAVLDAAGRRNDAGRVLADARALGTCIPLLLALVARGDMKAAAEVTALQVSNAADFRGLSGPSEIPGEPQRTRRNEMLAAVTALRAEAIEVQRVLRAALAGRYENNSIPWMSWPYLHGTTEKESVEVIRAQRDYNTYGYREKAQWEQVIRDLSRLRGDVNNARWGSSKEGQSVPAPPPRSASLDQLVLAGAAANGWLANLRAEGAYANDMTARAASLLAQGQQLAAAPPDARERVQRKHIRRVHDALVAAFAPAAQALHKLATLDHIELPPIGPAERAWHTRPPGRAVPLLHPLGPIPVGSMPADAGITVGRGARPPGWPADAGPGAGHRPHPPLPAVPQVVPEKDR